MPRKGDPAGSCRSGCRCNISVANKEPSMSSAGTRPSGRARLAREGKSYPATTDWPLLTAKQASR